MMTTKPAFTRRDWWYLGGLVAVTFAYFWRAAIGRGVFFHHDLHALFYPMKAFYVEALRALRLPMWNPYIGAGYPQFAEGQIAALYPLNPLLFGLLPLPLAFNHLIIWHFALAGVFFYLFLRKRGLGGAASFLGAIIFEWSGFMAAHLPHPSITCSLAWLPLLLYFLEDGRQRAQAGRSLLRPVLSGGAVVAIQALAGFPPVLFYSLLTGAIYVLCAGIGLRRAALLWGGMIVVGLSVGAVQWLPTGDLALHAVRTEMTPLDRMVLMTSYGLTPRQLPTLLFPNYVGSSAYGTYVGLKHSWELCGYLGLLSLPLIVTGVTRRWRRGWPLVVIGVVGLGLALGPGNPVYQVLCYVPGFNFFRAAGRYLLLWTIAGAALAAEGVEALLAAPPTRSRRTALIEAAAVALTLAAVAIPVWFRRTWPEHASRPTVLPTEWLFLAAGLLLFVALVAVARAGGSRRLLWACGSAAILADLLVFAAPLAPLAPVGLLYTRPPWTVQQIIPDSSWYRVWAWRTMGPEDRYTGESPPWALDFDPYLWDQSRLKRNLQALWRVRGVEANVGFVRDLEALGRLSALKSNPDIHEGYRYVRPVANLLGAKYLVLRQREPDLELLDEREKLLLYRNPNVLPRARVVGAAEPVFNETQELLRAVATDFPLRDWVVLNASPPVPLVTPGEIPSTITFEDPRPEIIRLRTRTDAPGMLVLSESYAPDWRVTLDGRDAPHFRAQYLVQAVFLPAGNHTVEFRYDNLAYQMGLRISLMAAAIWMGLAIRAWWRRRRLPVS
jgi:hypothetical protein